MREWEIILTHYISSVMQEKKQRDVNGIYIFDNVLADSFTLLQEQIYYLFINYFNFAISFNNAKNVLLQSFTEHKNTNIIFNSLFIIHDMNSI